MDAHDQRHLLAMTAVIRAEVNRREADALDTLRRLLESARHGEDAVQDVVIGFLADIGYEPRLVRASGRDIATSGEFVAQDAIDPLVRTSVVGQSGSGASGRSLLLWAHPDGMPYTSARGWSHSPFAGETEGGRIYGWGIADDLSGVAAALMVGDILRGLGIHLGGELCIASTPSKGHASGILAVLDSGIRADAGIYLHPAESGNGLGDIKALTSGLIRFRLRVEGDTPDTREPNHTLFAHDAADPIEKMRLLMHALRELDERRRASLRNRALDAFVGRSTSMMFSTIAAGDSPSRVAPVCELTVSMTTPPNEVIADVQYEIVQAIYAVTSLDPWMRHHPPRIEWLFGTTGVQLSDDHPLYRTVENAIRAATGMKPRYYPGHTASEIRQPMLNYGIPAIGFGPLAGSFTQAGEVDEWLDVRDYLRTITACAVCACQWCGVISDDVTGIPPHLIAAPTRADG